VLQSRPQGALRSIVGSVEHGEDVPWSPAELLELVELVDFVDICGHGKRAAPAARDLVGRFFQKSLRQHRFFGDVRMTPEHFDKLVQVTTPHLPDSTRGPHAINPPYRTFAVLFCLARGGRQRVIARAVDVAESTFSKYCTPIFSAMLAGLPKPVWPNHAERQAIRRDFARLTGGSLSGWSGLYDSFFHCLDLSRVLLMILLACLANVCDECTRRWTRSGCCRRDESL